MARRAESIEVLIADDDDQFRRELIDILSADADLVVVGEATDGEAAVAMAADLVPDIVLIDVWLPGTGGIEATRAIKEWLPMTRVLMLTDSEDEADLYKAMRGGASGYLLKDSGLDSVVSSVRSTVAGQSVLTPSMATMAFAEFSDATAYLIARLSDRELEILRLVAEGEPNSEIAEHLFLLPHTVKRHVANILEKTQFVSRAPPEWKLAGGF